jgi:Mn2+/Fe2+ NRAMP family transporter
MFLVAPGSGEVLASLKPAMPERGEAHLVLAAMVGTTMASVCIVARSYLVAEQGWSLADLKTENRDAIVSLSLTLLVSAAIMACAAATMRPAGIPVENAIDMVKTLEPLSGRFATAVFVTGIVAAALSSLFPNYVLGPWLVCDYLNVSRNMARPAVRLAVASAALLAFVVPIFGGRPVLVMIVSQAISPVVMPLLIVLLLVLLNSQSLGKEGSDYKNPLALNVGLLLTLAFALLVSYSAVVGLLDSVRDALSAGNA